LPYETTAKIEFIAHMNIQSSAIRELECQERFGAFLQAGLHENPNFMPIMAAR
jgi:hypothetical protein